MVARFGAREMIRASTPDGAEAVALVDAPIQSALDDATAMIDTYLRKRYRTPLDVAPQEVNACCCYLARYTLQTGGGRAPGEQVQKDRDAQVSWLKLVADGRVLLAIAEVAPGGESYAQQQSRPQVFADQGPAGGCYGDGFFNGGAGWP